VCRADKDLADEGEDDEHSRVGMARSKERLLKRGGGLPATHHLQHEPAAELDGHYGQQEHPRGASGVS
jgi:hypothetical protein